MSVYKGFITLRKCLQLRDKVHKIADIRGLENKIHHLYQPDTDMADVICEDFVKSKSSILLDILTTINELVDLAFKIEELEEQK